MAPLCCIFFLLISFSAALSPKGHEGLRESKLNHDSPLAEKGDCFAHHLLWPFPAGLRVFRSCRPLFCKQEGV